MLNFENPPPSEELENENPAPAENGELFDTQNVEFPHVPHHFTQENTEETAPAEQDVSAVEPERKPATLRKISIPRYKEEGDTGHHLFQHRASENLPDGRKEETARILTAARAASGLTQIEIEERTKIRAFYIEALENGHFDQLPQQVYVMAYLRRLAELYGIKGADQETLLEPWKDIPCEIPENLPASVYPDPDNPNRKTLHRLEIALYIAGGVLAIGVVAFAITLFSSWLSGTRKAVNPPFDRELLLELQPKPVLTAPAQPKVKQ